MEERSEILDTNVIISKKEIEGIVTLPVLIELMNYLLEQYNYFAGKGEKRRAMGYLNEILNLPILLQRAKLLGFDIDDVRDIVYYIVERHVDPTDAYLALISKKFGLIIVTNDKDFERLSDIAKTRDP